MHYYFYKTTNKVNGKYYFGVHSTNVARGQDSYLGSGTLLWKAIDKYGKENFSKEVLKEFKTLEEAYAWEASVVTEELVKDPNCYNVQVGGRGGSGGTVFIHRGQEHIKILPEQLPGFLEQGWSVGRSKENNAKYYRPTLSEEHKKKISKAMAGKPSPLRGTHLSKEHREKISAARKGRSNYWALGVPRSEETKRKISEANKGRKHPEWRRKKNSESHRGLPGTTTGRLSVWKDGTKRYVPKHEVQSYLEQGYFRTKKESLWQTIERS